MSTDETNDNDKYLWVMTRSDNENTNKDDDK